VVGGELRLLERKELALQWLSGEVEHRHRGLVVGDDVQPVAEPDDAAGGRQVIRRAGE
jgi:hypothetical protein